MQVLLLPLRELVPVAQARDARPDALAGRAEQLEDVQQLLQLGVAREQRLLARELGEDGAHGPHVHGRGVVAPAQQNLRRAVPQRDDLVRVRLHRHGKRASQPEIRNLDDVLRLVHEQVLRLQVAVHHAVAVQVRAPEAKLVHEVLHHGLGQGVGRAAAGHVHVVLQILVQVLKHQVQHGFAVLLHVLNLEKPARGRRHRMRGVQGGAREEARGQRPCRFHPRARAPPSARDRSCLFEKPVGWARWRDGVFGGTRVARPRVGGGRT